MRSKIERLPVKVSLKLCQDDPDHIELGMNRPDAVASLDAAQATEIALEALEWGAIKQPPTQEQINRMTFVLCHELGHLLARGQ